MHPHFAIGFWAHSLGPPCGSGYLLEQGKFNTFQLNTLIHRYLIGKMVRNF